MNTNTTSKQLLKLGRLIQQERALSAKVRAIRDKLSAHTGRGYFTSWSGTPTTLTVSIELSQYLTMFPGVKPDATVVADEDGKEYGRLFYPSQLVGEIGDGQTMLVNSVSERFEMPTKTVEAVKEAA